MGKMIFALIFVFVLAATGDLTTQFEKFTVFGLIYILCILGKIKNQLNKNDNHDNN